MEGKSHQQFATNCLTAYLMIPYQLLSWSTGAIFVSSLPI